MERTPVSTYLGVEFFTATAGTADLPRLQFMPTRDEPKRLRNLRSHGLDFIGAEAIWDAFTVTREDCRDVYGEPRWITLGLLRGEIVVLIHTEHGTDDRYISLRRADTYEAISYLEAAGWKTG